MVFGRCNFSCSELQSIFVAAKHIKILKFIKCKLDVTDEFDISQETFHIEQLLLYEWGDYSEWNNIDGLEILVKAVANSSLKHSLKQIMIEDRYMDYMGIEYKDKVKEIFERLDLQHVHMLYG